MSQYQHVDASSFGLGAWLPIQIQHPLVYSIVMNLIRGSKVWLLFAYPSYWNLLHNPFFFGYLCYLFGICHSKVCFLRGLPALFTKLCFVSKHWHSLLVQLWLISCKFWSNYLHSLASTQEFEPIGCIVPILSVPDKNVLETHLQIKIRNDCHHHCISTIYWCCCFFW